MKWSKFIQELRIVLLMYIVYILPVPRYWFRFFVYTECYYVCNIDSHIELWWDVRDVVHFKYEHTKYFIIDFASFCRFSWMTNSYVQSSLNYSRKRFGFFNYSVYWFMTGPYNKHLKINSDCHMVCPAHTDYVWAWHVLIKV